MDVAVEIAGLDRRYGTTPVLSSLDLDVAAGERVAISGPNGSGKTTLLRVIAGLLRPTKGSVRVFGGEVSDPAVRKRVGVAAHMPALYPRLTALENIRFWSALYGDDDGPERGRSLLTTLALDPDDKRPVSAYSQGMRQRTSIARALCTDPDLVIADEPFAALDPSGAETIASLLNRARTAIVATHERGHFDATRSLVMRGGSLLTA